MAEHVYRLTEIVGTSPDGLDAAIQTGIKRAASTLHGLDWFQVSDIRGQISEGRSAAPLSTCYSIGWQPGCSTAKSRTTR
jgi:flavin-binding protein dodecin